MARPKKGKTRLSDCSPVNALPLPPPSLTTCLRDGVFNTGQRSEILSEVGMLTLEGRALSRYVKWLLPGLPDAEVAIAFGSNQTAIGRVLANIYNGKPDTVEELRKCRINERRLASLTATIQQHAERYSDGDLVQPFARFLEELEAPTPPKRPANSARRVKPEVVIQMSTARSLRSASQRESHTQPEASSSVNRKRKSTGDHEPGGSCKRAKLTPPGDTEPSMVQGVKAVRSFLRKAYKDFKPDYLDELTAAGFSVDELRALRKKDKGDIIKSMKNMKNLPSDFIDSPRKLEFFALMIVNSRKDKEMWKGLKAEIQY